MYKHNKRRWEDVGAGDAPGVDGERVGETVSALYASRRAGARSSAVTGSHASVRERGFSSDAGYRCARRWLVRVRGLVDVREGGVRERTMVV